MAGTAFSEAVRDLQRYLERPAATQLLIRPGEREALHARELLRHFESDASTAASEARTFIECLPVLEQLLAVRGQWDGETQSLEDALMLGYAGFSDLGQLEMLSADVRRNAPDHSVVISRASDFLSQAGLRCRWAGPAVVASWLSYVMWNSRLPPNLRRLHPSFWPEAGRTITDAAAQTMVGFDPTAESRAEFLKKAQIAASELEHSAARRHLESGYVRFTDARQYRRNVLATFLRISDSAWTWRRIRDRAFPPTASLGAAQAAVDRVKRLLNLEMPPRKPGRPRGK